MKRQRVGFLNRVRQSQRLLRSDGPSALVDRVRHRLAEKIRPSGAKMLEVSRQDFVRAAEFARDGWRLPGPAPRRAGDRLTIGWVCTPPGPGSGGHTTMFRMVAALADAGHRCVVYLQDQHGWSIEQHRQTIRQWWPWVSAEVRDYEAGVEDCQVLFATSWGTAYAVLGSNAQGIRAYFVQDFEPDFAPAGSESLLAEATYQFGFHGVTAGRWLAELLERDYGMTAESFDFGCDLDTYYFDRQVAPERRTGVCYYCRPSTPRRAHELAMLALDFFAERHPEIDIHLFGEPIARPHFAAIHHGLLAPADLGRLYNTCIAGLVLSATNVSLVPHEMLAAGCIPVVNDAEHNRLVLANDYVAYANATPYDLAEALVQLVERPADERVVAAEVAAASVKATTWTAASEQFVRIVERMVETRSED